MGKTKREERIGAVNYNKQGVLMKVISYISVQNIIVEFQDEYREKVQTEWKEFINGTIKNPYENKRRLGLEKKNNQGCLMKIIEYQDSRHIIVEFQDQYKEKIQTSFGNFTKGSIKNHYYPTICGVGIVGNKYAISDIDSEHKNNKEYNTWVSIIKRSYNKNTKNKQPAYQDVICCDEWLLYENFYEWLHSQENFDKWLNTPLSAIDKDILVKGNKVYSPETCCLVPNYINSLFTKNNATRGELPIGVEYDNRNQKFIARCGNNKDNSIYIGAYDNKFEAFHAYKKYKENFIKQIAKEEYDKGNITKRCYNAMMKYEVEITD